MPVEAVQAIVEVIGGVGSYLARVLGSIPEDALGLIVGDWLHHKRRENLSRIEANTAAILQGVDSNRLSDPSPSILIPLLQAAADESRAELQSLWATLLANSMMDGGRTVRRAFIETAKQMDPADAQLLDIFSRVKVHELMSETQVATIKNSSKIGTGVCTHCVNVLSVLLFTTLQKN
jgi:hypothetical protein